MDESLFSGYSLVVGSGLSGYEFSYDELYASLFKRYGSDDQGGNFNFWSYVDYLISDKDIREHEIREYIVSKLTQSHIDPILSKIAGRPWKSIISTSIDDSLSSEFNTEFSKGITSRSISIITSRGISPIHGSIPFFSIMGSISDERRNHAASLTHADYLRRRRDWREILAAFPDYSKGAPLVFMGTNRDAIIVADLINELLGMKPGLPKTLYFFKGDPCAKNPSIVSLIEGCAEIKVLDITLKRWLESVGNESTQLSLPFGSMEDINYELLSQVSERALTVPRECDLTEYDPASKNRVIDYLFRPSEISWEPFRQQFDLKRCITNEINLKIEDYFINGKSGVLMLMGEASVGKTIVMKRLAYDFASKDYLSFWLKKSLGSYGNIPWSTVVKSIAQAISGAVNTRVVLFFDGATDNSDHLDELIRSLSNESFQWCLVFCRRKTDKAFSDESLFVSSKVEFSNSDISFSNELTEKEIERLPDYLVHINTTQDRSTAIKIVETVRKKNASDFLCALWYLMPQTQSSISGSLIDEYFNLGGTEGVITKLAEKSESKMGWAKKAYELVTTCSGLNVPLPVEVLVRTLQIDYEDWLSACVDGEPLWGLIYGEDYKDGQSIAYRTRNDVVTKVLLRAVNGGSASHIGEFRCLKEILVSCDIGSPVYRDTACELLIQKKKELKRFSYAQGLELFDEALNALPFDDRAITHHRGIWIRDNGSDLNLAYEAISESLQKDDYPLSERTENQGNIHTSLASCLVRQLEVTNKDHDDYSKRLEQIEIHIEESEKKNPFDLYNRHVSANMFIKIANRFKGVDENLHLTSMANAVKIISSSLSLIPKGHLIRSTHHYDSFQLIKDLEEKLFQISDDFDENNDMALKLYESSNDQTGFYVLLKVLIAEASSKNKGKLFNRADDYLKRIEKLVGQDDLDTKIIECRADLEIKWKILSKSVAPPDWALLESDLSVVIDHQSSSTNILYYFYKAVALYHLKDIRGADATFHHLRRMDMPGDIRRSRRCYFLDRNGNPQIFQGEITTGQQQKYVHCTVLSTEVFCANEFSERKDALVNYYLAFSFQGPIAVKRPPSDY